MNSLVTLIDAQDREYRSRIEGAEPGLLTVARPMDLLADDQPHVDDELLVTWPDGRGIGTVRVRLVALQREGHLRFWDVAVLGEPWSEQRREYVRADLIGPITVVEHGVAEGVLPRYVDGRLIDLSEGGVRCAVEHDQTPWLVAGETSVLASFSVDGEEFELPGEVTHRTPNENDASLAEIVIVFVRPVAGEQKIRRHVYDLQRLGREPR